MDAPVLCDTHCHLNFDSFAEDLPEVLERARQTGVRRILNPAIDLETSREIVALTDAIPELYAAIGVHPNDGATWRKETRGALAELARHPKVAAIGEIGLDYYRDRTPAVQQQHIFAEQLALAAELELPVVIHIRDLNREHPQATADTLQMLADWTTSLKQNGSPLAERPGVLHSFSSGVQAAKNALELGFMLGFTGPVTFKKAEALHTTVENTPVERILVETDAPFLTPHPHRGQRNEPSYVQFVVSRIAELHNLPTEQIEKITTENAGRLFRW